MNQVKTFSERVKMIQDLNKQKYIISVIDNFIFSEFSFICSKKNGKLVSYKISIKYDEVGLLPDDNVDLRYTSSINSLDNIKELILSADLECANEINKSQ